MRTASFSRDGLYRYRLGRKWADSGGTLAFVMLNPSKANGTRDDATIGLCMSIAKRLGHGSIVVVNLYGRIETNPRNLLAARRDGVDIVGPSNAHHLRAVLSNADRVVFAWGCGHDSGLLPTPRKVGKLLAYSKTTPMCLGHGANNQPLHPRAAATRGFKDLRLSRFKPVSSNG